MKKVLKDVTNITWNLMNKESKKVNIINFLTEFAETNPEANIIIGTDSQTIGRSTTYVTAIVAELPDNRGSRVIYTKEKIKSFKNSWERLALEAMRSLEITQFLISKGIKVTHVELDYQDDESMSEDYIKTVSRPLYKSYKGMIETIGCHVTGKSEPPNSKDETLDKARKYKILGAIAAADKLSK